MNKAAACLITVAQYSRLAGAAVAQEDVERIAVHPRPIFLC
jgi:hypothetical protein